MPDGKGNAVAEYRENARHLRVQAETMTTPRGVAMLLRLADESEQTADALELKHRAKQTSHDEKRAG